MPRIKRDRTVRSQKENHRIHDLTPSTGETRMLTDNTVSRFLDELASNSLSDAGVSAVMLHAACESAALNVQINLASITDSEFVGWRTEEITTLRRTSAGNLEQVLAIVARRISGA